MLFFFFNDTATTEIYTLSLHDALPICISTRRPKATELPGVPGRAKNTSPGSMSTPCAAARCARACTGMRSEEHTSELQSPCNLVCRLLLEKKKKKKNHITKQSIQMHDE